MFQRIRNLKTHIKEVFQSKSKNYSSADMAHGVNGAKECGQNMFNCMKGH